jgi:valyl-tRNA synthetase
MVCQYSNRGGILVGMKLPKSYEPAEYEADIYALWEKSNAFAPSGKGKPYSIVVPPPNANGDLHLGHALTLAIEDIAVRFHRLRGDRALLVPGADHAGFETQVVYERRLAKEGKSRFDFTREELYKGIWDFVAENRDNFENQYRRLGASVDWNHYTFTLDEKIIKRAYKTFKKMWDEGLIYRGERLVNFCTHHGTAFADIEVEYKEEQGHLWEIRYPLVDGSGAITVATTRPETMLGDVAVAVHPEDERYKDFVGKTVKLPLTEREIPIITDDFVDKDFGTGAVKITPAHDPNDFEAGERHDLPKITVISHEGRMMNVPEKYLGLTVDEARKVVVKDLEEQGVLVGAKKHPHSVGHCYKCGTVIQPLLREQWFVDMEPLAKRAIEALEAGEITFYPEAKKKQLITYLKQLKDWNISRQIAWGIPIPAFQNIDEPTDWIYDEHVTEEIVTRGDKTYRRDPDVFDTWFSSGQWPFATLEYPDSDKYEEFYPLSLMETGFDILMPWVSRMIMLGLYVTNKVPFKAVYLHGLILDEHGQKMSKSKGNVTNPLEVADKYGSDALRMGIISGQSAGNNQPFVPGKVVGARNFANKLWNVARFTENLTGENYQPNVPKPETVADHWILHKLQHTSDELVKELESYRFSEAYERVYHFIWDDLADWYIEASKAAPNVDLLAYVLESALTLAHPFAPFVTETIWQALNWREELLISYTWPDVPKFEKKAAADFEDIKTIVVEARYITNALKEKGSTLYFIDAPLLAENSELIARLAKLHAVKQVESGEGLHLTQTKYKSWLDIDQATAKNYLKELEAKKADQTAVIDRLKGRLANKSYVDNAPKQIVEQTKQQLKEAEAVLNGILREYERFNS